jgi:oligopeptide transport system ATP-binding protein
MFETLMKQGQCEDESMEPLLSVRNLSVRFATASGHLRAVRELDLDVKPGEFVALLGESGSGKSVTARAIMGLTDEHTTVTADRLQLGGIDLLSLNEEERRRLRGERMSLVLQDALSALNPVLSVGDQIGELYRVHRHASRKQARAGAIDMLGLVGIPSPSKRVDDYPHQFSGGMRQRILIAMAIALEPELIIADEPTTALDVTVQAQILELLQRLREQLGTAIVLITHDLGVVMEVADRLEVMYAGRIVEGGDADDVLDQPAHPYTQALLRSVPRVEARGGDLVSIPGAPPSPAQVPVGCSFHPRCAWAVEVCLEKRPLLVDVGEGREAACFRSEEVLRDRAIVV